MFYVLLNGQVCSTGLTQEEALREHDRLLKSSSPGEIVSVVEIEGDVKRITNYVRSIK